MGARKANERRQSELRRLVWRFQAFGFTYEQAVNLAATELGMPPNPSDWTEAQISRYLFLQDLYDHGRFRPD